MKRQTWRREDGVSLIEVLVAVVIMGVTFASILGAISTAIIGSDIDRAQVKVETELRSFAEYVKDQGYKTPMSLTACVSTGGTYGSGYVSTQAGVTATATGVSFWVPGSNPATFVVPSTPPPTDPVCATNSGLHGVTLTATTSNPSATETVHIFVRDDAP